MPTRVYLLRHGESANPHVFHGAESDVALGERGIQQAQAIAQWLAPRRPAGVVASAMQRACQTATPIAQACGLPLHIEPALHERRVGDLSGLPFHARDGLWPDTLRRWMAGDTSFAPDGAESFEDIRTRVMPIWQRLTTTFAERSLVIVAHGVVCKVLLLTLLPGYSVADWQRLGPIRNVAISELVAEGESWQALMLNELPAPLQAQGLG